MVRRSTSFRLYQTSCQSISFSDYQILALSGGDKFLSFLFLHTTHNFTHLCRVLHSLFSSQKPWMLQSSQARYLTLIPWSFWCPFQYHVSLSLLMWFDLNCIKHPRFGCFIDLSKDIMMLLYFQLPSSLFLNEIRLLQWSCAGSLYFPWATHNDQITCLESCS